MRLNRKTKPRATRNPKAAIKAYKTLIWQKNIKSTYKEGNK